MYQKMTSSNRNVLVNLFDNPSEHLLNERDKEHFDLRALQRKIQERRRKTVQECKDSFVICWDKRIVWEISQFLCWNKNCFWRKIGSSSEPTEHAYLDGVWAKWCKAEIEGKIKDLLDSGLIYALKVGQCFNKMTNYDLSVVPKISGN